MERPKARYENQDHRRRSVGRCCSGRRLLLGQRQWSRDGFGHRRRTDITAVRHREECRDLGACSVVLHLVIRRWQGGPGRAARSHRRREVRAPGTLRRVEHRLLRLAEDRFAEDPRSIASPRLPTRRTSPPDHGRTLGRNQVDGDQPDRDSGRCVSRRGERVHRRFASARPRGTRWLESGHGTEFGLQSSPVRAITAVRPARYVRVGVRTPSRSRRCATNGRTRRTGEVALGAAGRVLASPGFRPTSAPAARSIAQLPGLGFSDSCLPTAFMKRVLGNPSRRWQNRVLEGR